MKLANAYSRSMVVRLVVFGICVVAVGLILRVMILLPYIRGRMVELSSEHQLAIAGYVARDIDLKIAARRNMLDRMAASLPPALLAAPGRLEAWLRERQEINPIFSHGFAVIPPDGHGATADYPVLAGRRALDFSGSDFFIGAVTERRPVIGKPIRGRASGEGVLVMAVPVIDSAGTVLAVLTGTTAIAAPDFLDLMQKTPIAKTGGFLLISPRDDIFVAATDPAKVLTPLPRPGVNPLHDRAMAGYRGTGVTVNLHGVEELSAMASVDNAGWFLVARVPTAEALEALDSARGFILRWALGLALMVVLLGGTLAHFFFKPLINTSRLIHRMAMGEIELQPLPVIRHDEVGDVAEGFNFLLSRLDEVTEQKLAAERMRLAEKERTATMLRQWMADTSHELRTPIAVLQAQIEAIQDGVFTVDAKRLGVLHHEVLGVSRLVNDLFALARSDTNQLECRIEPVDILGLLDDAVTAFHERFAEAGLEIRWPGHAEDGPMVSGDAMRLRQVLSNLLENSLRYTDAGGRLQLEWSVQDNDLLLHFDDTAPAVPPEALPRLFERFYRVDVSRSRASGGSGLGLCLCRSYVEAQGGTITVRASPLGGLGATIRLPRMERR